LLKSSKPFKVKKKYAAATRQLVDDIYIFLILLKPCILKSCKKSLRQRGKVNSLPEPDHQTGMVGFEERIHLW
jgi:hypothetical protein